MSYVLIEKQDSHDFWANKELSDWQELLNQPGYSLLGSVQSYAEAQALIAQQNYNQCYQDYLKEAYYHQISADYGKVDYVK